MLQQVKEDGKGGGKTIKYLCGTLFELCKEIFHFIMPQLTLAIALLQP